MKWGREHEDSPDPVINCCRSCEDSPVVCVTSLQTSLLLSCCLCTQTKCFLKIFVWILFSKTSVTSLSNLSVTWILSGCRLKIINKCVYDARGALCVSCKLIVYCTVYTHFICDLLTLVPINGGAAVTFLFFFFLILHRHKFWCSTFIFTGLWRKDEVRNGVPPRPCPPRWPLQPRPRPARGKQRARRAAAMIGSVSRRVSGARRGPHRVIVKHLTGCVDSSKTPASLTCWFKWLSHQQG